MKNAIFLATTALLTMLILVPMALAQEETTLPSSPFPSTFITGVAAGGGDNMGTTMVNGSPSPPLTPLEDTGGPDILLPAAVLLLGSGILTYAILRRR
jgi:hypothetical protein